MALTIKPGQYQTLRGYYDASDYAGGWAYLASIGDNYADNAYAVTTGLGTGLTDPLFESMVKHHWDNTAGEGAYEQKFEEVAEPAVPFAPILRPRSSQASRPSK